MPVLMTYAKAHVAREKAEIEAKERSSSSTASVSKELKERVARRAALRSETSRRGRYDE